MNRFIKTQLAAASIIAAGTAGMAAGDGAARQNENLLVLAGANTENVLTVTQTENSRNSARIFVATSETLLDGVNWQRETSSILEPGRLLQRGSDHILDLSASGQFHQVAISQTGWNQRALVETQGVQNLVSVSQSGQDNSASVTQTGLRNTVVISQH